MCHLFPKFHLSLRNRRWDQGLSENFDSSFFFGSLFLMRKACSWFFRCTWRSSAYRGRELPHGRGFGSDRSLGFWLFCYLILEIISIESDCFHLLLSSWICHRRFINKGGQRKVLEGSLANMYYFLIVFELWIDLILQLTLQQFPWVLSYQFFPQRWHYTSSFSSFYLFSCTILLLRSLTIICTFSNFWQAFPWVHV